MGISEQARNITDTSLKQVLTDAADPAGALKDHLLRLEQSLRELATGEELLARQCAWLAANIERNLEHARREEARAARLLQLAQEPAARLALADKRDALIRVIADQKQLRKLEDSLPPLRRQLSELRQRIDLSRSLRARLTAGELLRDEDLHRPPPPAPEPATTQTHPPDRERDELDRELDRLRQQLGLADESPNPGSEDPA